MPKWVEQGYREYAERLPRHCRLELEELPLGARGKKRSTHSAVELEGRKMLARLRGDELVIALCVDGDPWATDRLAKHLSNWLAGGHDVAMLVGGPDGLSPACLQRADSHWSLSGLTLPHGLVRVVIAEAVYRAWTLLQGHPYHRQ